MKLALHSLVLMISGFGPEVPGPAPHAANELPTACFVKFVVRKVHWLVVSSLLWVLFLEKISLLFQRHIKIVEMKIDGPAISRKETEIGLLPL